MKICEVRRILLALGLLFATVECDLCPSLFRRFSLHHTFCLPANASCKILTRGVTASYVEIILKEHNELRSKVATGMETTGPLPEAANMLQMVWDEELAEVAQKHADQCRMEHDCNECRKIKNFNVGQNLYEYLTTSTETLTPNWTAAAHAWYDEVEFFDLELLPSYNVIKTKGEYGHFTQLIWASSWRIGCGYTLFQDGEFQHELYTCNYGPDGNILEEPLYQAGKPCSSCPLDSSCDETLGSELGESYPGLCKITTEEGPLIEDKEDYIFQCDFKDSSSCNIETPEGMKNWVVIDSLTGSYIGVTLEGGESTVLNFATPFKAEKLMCMTLYYRKGPNVAGEEAANEAYELFHIVETGQEIKVPLNDNRNVFSKFSMGMNWVMETKFSVGFSVPETKPAQYFEFKDVKVKEGSC